MAAKGDAFWLKGTGSDINPYVPHLYCAITAPCPKGEQLIVNISSRTPPPEIDPACLLDVGDHPDITGPSYVYFAMARLVWPKAYASWVEGRMVHPTKPFSPPVLQRIENGLQISAHITPKLKAYYAAH